ncbi:hypothetical protein WJX84_005021 [Apatococcus fuscideae]|uniref:Uncharacterized protein n=1 Tax=Apatococcus fuscideae TaxID=2026836 RepID=A0AAW1SQS8_9CHLO
MFYGSALLYGVAVAIYTAHSASAAFFGREPPREPQFEIVPLTVSNKGKDPLSALSQLSDEEGLFSRLFGTDCYSDMSDRHFNTFNEFFTNVDSMCLFLQNQDFQKHTEAVLNILSTGARQAADQLQSMNTSLGGQLRVVGRMGLMVDSLQQGQERVAAGVEKGIDSVQQLQSQAMNLDEKLAFAIRNEERMLQRQTDTLQNLAALDMAELERAASSNLRWKEAQEQARVLSQQQQEHLALQSQLLADLRHLADSSRGLQTAMDLVLDYEQRSHTALAHLLGRSWTSGDLLFHAACALAVLCAGSARRAKLATMAAPSRRTVPEMESHKLRAMQAFEAYVQQKDHEGTMASRQHNAALRRHRAGAAPQQPGSRSKKMPPGQPHRRAQQADRPAWDHPLANWASTGGAQPSHSTRAVGRRGPGRPTLQHTARSALSHQEQAAGPERTSSRGTARAAARSMPQRKASKRVAEDPAPSADGAESASKRRLAR